MPTSRIIKRDDDLGIGYGPGFAGIKVDTTSRCVQFNDEGTMRSLVDTTSAQTISGDKTFTGTVVISGIATISEFADGTAALPSITFSDDLNTGIYRIGADNLGIALAGAVEFNLTTSAFSPGANAGNALGTTSLGWNGLHLGTGTAINWVNGDVTITHAANQLTISGGKCTFVSPNALDFATIVPSTETDGTIMTTGTTWPAFATAGQCGIKLLLNDACATGNFATIRARAKSSVARTVRFSTLAGDFSASAAVSEYKDLIGVSAYGQVPAAYTQTNANHVVCGVKAAITDFTGATSSGSRYALWVDDACINKAGNGHYLIFAQKLTGAATIDGVMQVRGDLFTYGLNFSEATFATADIVFQNSDTLSNLVAGTLAASGKLTATYTATSATPGTNRALVGSVTTFSTMTSGNLVGARGDATMAGAASSTAFIYGVQGKAITGANAFSGTVLAGLYGQIDISGGTATSGHIAAIQANIYGANAGAYAMEGIYVESAGGGVINSFIQCFGKSTYVFDLASNTHNQMATTSTTVTNVSTKGWLKVFVEGSVRYIALGDGVT